MVFFSRQFWRGIFSSRMRSEGPKGFRLTLEVWRLESCSLSVVLVFATVRNRPQQPFGAVAKPCPWTVRKKCLSDDVHEVDFLTNSALMLRSPITLLKVYLSDPSHWVVFIYCHTVPIESSSYTVFFQRRFQITYSSTSLLLESTYCFDSTLLFESTCFLNHSFLFKVVSWSKVLCSSPSFCFISVFYLFESRSSSWTKHILLSNIFSKPTYHVTSWSPLSIKIFSNPHIPFKHHLLFESTFLFWI